MVYTYQVDSEWNREEAHWFEKGNYNIQNLGLHRANKTNIAESQTFKFELAAGTNLQVMASADAKCDVYEMETGKLLFQDVAVVGNNSFQTTPVKPSNNLYFMVFKVGGKVVSQQHFIFNNSNHLSIGGQND
jgi:hypothetical protein